MRHMPYPSPPCPWPKLTRIGLILVGILANHAGHCSERSLQPFVIEHPAKVDSPVDLSFLLEEPAGKDGFIRVDDGHLVKPDGSRFRIWGVNLTGWTPGSTNLPPKSEAAHWADVLARHGINGVRFHFLDLSTWDPEKAQERAQRRQEAESRGRRNSIPPEGLVDHRHDDTQHLDPEALDRLDYFIHALKERGIYSNLNLNVGRMYRAGDNVPDHDLIWVAKAYTYVGDRLIELQKDYARQLLTHHNPYTGNNYANEPAVATVEIVNENSLLEFWMRNWLRGELSKDGPRHQLDFTPYYASLLTRKYNQWLENNRSPKELAELKREASVAPDQPMPRLRRGDFSIASARRFHSEAEFYIQLEQEFFRGMHDYIKHGLGVKAPVIGNADHTYWIPSQPMLCSNSLTDYLDGHVYWQHPAIWKRRNTPMVNEPLASTIVKLSRSPMEGRAYTVSEVNHPNPNEYSAEMIPILAAYAAFQDWDGIYFYTFEPKAGEDWDAFVSDYFDITLDPVKMIQMRIGALMFSRSDIAMARKTVTRSYTREQVYETMRMPESARPYFTPGFPESLPLRHGSRISSLDGAPTGNFEPDPEPPLVSDTGELQWHLPQGEDGVVSIDSPRSQALVGFVRDTPVDTRHLRAYVQNEFCAITLSSLTEAPIQRSARLLLTACSRWQNTGSSWNERRTLWENWGEGPTLIEPVTGWLLLKELDGAVAVMAYPLDGAGRKTGEPVEGRRLENGWGIELGKYPTNHYFLEVIK